LPDFELLRASEMPQPAKKKQQKKKRAIEARFFISYDFGT